MGPAASTTRMPTHAMANPAGSRSGPRRSTVPPYASARPMLAVATPEKLATPTTKAPMKMQRCGQMKNVSRPIERCHDVSKNTPVMMDRPPTAAAARNTAGRFRVILRSILSGMGLPLNRVCPAGAQLNQVPRILSEDFVHGRGLEGVQFLDPFASSFEPAALD